MIKLIQIVLAVLMALSAIGFQYGTDTLAIASVFSFMLSLTLIGILQGIKEST